MVLLKEPGVVSVASKPYDLPLKHHKFVKEELTNLLEAGLIERSLIPHAAPNIVLPHEATPGRSLTKTKRLVIDYCEHNKSLKYKLLRLSPKAALCSKRQQRLTTFGQN